MRGVRARPVGCLTADHNVSEKGHRVRAFIQWDAMREGYARLGTGLACSLLPWAWQRLDPTRNCSCPGHRGLSLLRERTKAAPLLTLDVDPCLPWPLLGLVGPHAEIAALRAWCQREAVHAEHLELRSFALLALLHRTCRACLLFLSYEKKGVDNLSLRQALGHFRGSFRFA